MAVALHIVLSAYGFWLPNDPRGSWSRYLASSKLRAFGPITAVAARASVAHIAHDERLRLQAKEALLRPPVRFEKRQGELVGAGLCLAAKRAAVPVWACAVMPDHVHLVTGVPGYPVDRFATQLKAATSSELVRANLHPGAQQRRKGRLPSLWAEKQWIVYLDTAEQVRRAIDYVWQNPVVAGLPEQNWPFLTVFEE